MCSKERGVHVQWFLQEQHLERKLLVCLCKTSRALSRTGDHISIYCLQNAVTLCMFCPAGQSHLYTEMAGVSSSIFKICRMWILFENQ